MEENSNDRTPEQEALWRQKQLRDSENAFIGMRSRSFGSGVGGEFIQETKGINPLQPNWGPHEQQIIEAATGEVIVSANPEISTLVDISPEMVSDTPIGANLTEASPSVPEPPTSPVIQDPQVFDAMSGQAETEIPTVGTPVFGSSVSADSIGPIASRITETPPSSVLPTSIPVQSTASPVESVMQQGIRAVSVPVDQAPAAVQPMIGAGRPPVNEQEKQQVVRQGEARLAQARADRQQRREAAVEAKQVAAGKGGEQVPVPTIGPPSRSQGGAGPSSYGSGYTPDYGTSGSTSYSDPTASQIALLDHASEAVESTNLIVDAMVELLRRLTANMLKHEESLKDLLDKSDIEDAADEF